MLKILLIAVCVGYFIGAVFAVMSVWMGSKNMRQALMSNKAKFWYIVHLILSGVMWVCIMIFGMVIEELHKAVFGRVKDELYGK